MSLEERYSLDWAGCPPIKKSKGWSVVDGTVQQQSYAGAISWDADSSDGLDAASETPLARTPSSPRSEKDGREGGDDGDALLTDEELDMWVDQVEGEVANCTPKSV